MSVEVSTWAWRQELPSTRKIVLLALADHADAGGVCWPSIETLIDKTGLSQATVYRAIRELKAGDLLDERDGKWILRVIERFSEREQISQSENDTNKEPSIEPSKESSVSLPLTRKNGPQQRSEEIRNVFDYWRETFGKNGRTKLTPERVRKIKARMESYSAAEIKQAIDGCAASEWHVKNGQTDLELICRNDTKLEAFRDKAPAAPEPETDDLPAQLRAQGRHDEAEEAEKWA